MKYASYLLVLFLGVGIGYSIAPKSSTVNSPDNHLSPDLAKSNSKRPELQNQKQASLQGSTNQPHADNLVTPSKYELAAKDRFDEAMVQNDFDKAWAAVREMELKSNTSEEFLENSSRLLVRTRKWDDAKKSLQQCLSSFPGNRSCLIDMASTELQVGSKEEMTAAVESCLNRFPNEPQCHNMSAIAKMNSGNFAEAVTIYENLLKNNGSFGIRYPAAMLHSQLGFALEGAGRKREAAEQFYRACREDDSPSCDKYEQLRRKI